LRQQMAVLEDTLAIREQISELHRIKKKP
jgi:hypothetical protein